MTKIDTEELYAFNKLIKESKEGLDQKIKQSNYAIAGFSKEDKLTGGAWSSAKNHFDKGYTPLIDSFDSALVLLVDKFSDYTTEFRQQVTGGSVVLDTDQLQDLEIRMQQLASYKVQWLLDMADQLAGIPGIGKFFDEVSLNSTKKEVILLRKFQEFEHSHRNEFAEIAEALHFLRIGLEAVGNKKNFQGATKGFGPIDFNKDSWASNLSKFNERNKNKVDFIKESDAMAAGAVAEQTAQIHNAQMNVNQMADAMMNEVNRSSSYTYNPLGGKSWFRGEGGLITSKYKDISRFQYNSIENPGPLALIRNRPNANFYGGRYNVKVLETDTVFYRSGEKGEALGQWFTSVPSESVAKVRTDLAVKPQWINPITGELEGKSTVNTNYSIKIPKGTTIYEGPVGLQSGLYSGGLNTNQIFIPKAWEIQGIEVMDISKLK
ncbi:T7SS effector LXG polymorphic toxin [Carnobacterium maltaromaticum]|uniref:T7SS effector LXG polymorphic toxin n=1 Tax=Carnobacterium maltaromaticum TaxID=2751 RepID=UPI0012FA9288|nr:T7SS effector LXG polymorphic toxin [Carnobacterium maltaromaticum]